MIHHNRNANRTLIHHFANGSSLVHSSASTSSSALINMLYCFMTSLLSVNRRRELLHSLLRRETWWRKDLLEIIFSHQCVSLLTGLMPVFFSHPQTKSLPLALLISFYVQNEYHIHMFMPWIGKPAFSSKRVPLMSTQGKYKTKWQTRSFT